MKPPGFPDPATTISDVSSGTTMSAVFCSVMTALR
jgi:hypothetical protein